MHLLPHQQVGIMRASFIQTATDNRLMMDILTSTAMCLAHLLSIFIFTVPSTSSPSSSGLTASTSIRRSPSILLLMLNLLPLRLLFLLLLLLLLVVTVSSVILTFVTHVIVASFIAVVTHHFFGDANSCTFTTSVTHVVACGLGVIAVVSSGCLGPVTSLLWRENALKVEEQ